MRWRLFFLLALLFLEGLKEQQKSVPESNMYFAVCKMLSERGIYVP